MTSALTQDLKKKGMLEAYVEAGKEKIGKTKERNRERDRIRLRARLLQDQRANSVADMAYVLGRLAKPEVEEPTGNKETPETKPMKWPAKKTPSIGLEGEGRRVEVQIRWRDLTDAEYAGEWSENVQHGLLKMHTNNRDPKKIWGVGRHFQGREVLPVPAEGVPEAEVQVETQPHKVVL